MCMILAVVPRLFLSLISQFDLRYFWLNFYLCMCIDTGSSTSNAYRHRVSCERNSSYNFSRIAMKETLLVFLSVSEDVHVIWL